ncbi:hypothetical protein [Luteipulveratus halotolerans]|nr:hypothetical protein [Luteipulveratus halotolerans]
MGRRVAATGVLIMLLAGCSTASGGAPSTSSANPPTPLQAYDRAADPVARQFDQRERYADCGSVVFEQGPYPGLPDGPLSCMRRARAAKATAELRVTRPTTEGDPIVTYFRVLGDGQVEVYADNTADSHGPADWTREMRLCVPDHEVLGQICRAS